MPKNSIVAWVIVFALSGGAALAGDACRELQDEIVGKTFVAKEPLYDTKIDLNGIVKLERDKEEIDKGDKFTVSKVVCGSGKIAMTLHQAKYKDDVDIYFKYPKTRRTEEGAQENIKRMMSYVFEEASEE